MSNDKYFGLDVEHSVSSLPMPGNPHHLVQINGKEIRETYQKFNDEMAKAQTPEDKKKILDTVFPIMAKTLRNCPTKTKN